MATPQSRHIFRLIGKHEFAGPDNTGVIVQVLESGYRGLRLVMNLNWDRLFFFGTIIVGLLAGAFLGSTLGTFALPH